MRGCKFNHFATEKVGRFMAGLFHILISGGVDKASATETVDFGSIPGMSNSDNQGLYFQLFCLTSSTRDGAKSPRCVVGRWAGVCVTRRHQNLFAVCWSRQFAEAEVS